MKVARASFVLLVDASLYWSWQQMQTLVLRNAIKHSLSDTPAVYQPTHSVCLH